MFTPIIGFAKIDFTDNVNGVTLTLMKVLPLMVNLSPLAAFAQENIIPSAYPVEGYEPLWKKSPFSLSSAAVPEAPPARFTDTLVLMGILKISDMELLPDACSNRILVITRPVNFDYIKELRQRGRQSGGIRKLHPNNWHTSGGHRHHRAE
jgi:hypothetical protein